MLEKTVINDINYRFSVLISATPTHSITTARDRKKHINVSLKFEDLECERSNAVFAIINLL